MKVQNFFFIKLKHNLIQICIDLQFSLTRVVASDGKSELCCYLLTCEYWMEKQ